MSIIPFVEVIERKSGSIDEVTVLQSYPFPDVSSRFVFENMYDCTIQLLRYELENIKDCNLRLAQLRRLSFILDIWHPNNFVRIEMKRWKYK